jgi:hypothetical protein
MPALRPGNRGIGVSVAVDARSKTGTEKCFTSNTSSPPGENGEKPMREVIRPLLVWDVSAGSAVLLEPGVVLSSCRIRKNGSLDASGEAEAYLMEFAWSGKTYRCPLTKFQPRTQAVLCQPAVLR